MSVSVTQTSMSGPAAASVLFHVMLVAVFMAGKPYISEPPPIYEQPISVEIANIDKITQTNRAPLQAPKPEKKVAKPERPAKTPPPEPAKPKASPVQKVPPPKVTAKPEIQDAEPSQDIVIPDPEKPSPPENPPKQKVKNKQIVTPIPPPPPKAGTDKTADEKESKSIENLLVSLVGEEEAVLKDLPKAKDNGEEEKAQDEPQDQQRSNIQRLSDQLTISERDALRQQLSQCWNIMAGARDAEDLVVKIRLTVNPDRTVRTAELINKSRYDKDSFFRAAADSALRAVRNPQCSPLRLPPDKYDEWKVIIVRFDPREML